MKSSYFISLRIFCLLCFQLNNFLRLLVTFCTRRSCLHMICNCVLQFVVDYLTKFSIAILSDMKDKEEDGRDGIECVSIILRHFNPQLAASMTIQSPTTSLLLTALSAQNSQLVLAALQQVIYFNLLVLN